MVASEGEAGGFAVTASFVVIVVRVSGGTFAAAACSSRVVGRASMPLAEKYSLRKSFRRMGLGAAASGSLLDEEILNCRLPGAFGKLESRARHLKHMVPCSGRFGATRPGRSSMSSHLKGGLRLHH